MNRTNAKTDRDPNSYKIIGLGTCGSVFSIPGTESVLKKGKDTKALWNDYCLTNTVHSAFTDIQDLLQDLFPRNTIPKTPHCNSFHLPTSHEYWSAHLNKYPLSHRETGAVIQEDRIPPIPQSTRETLIDLYFHSEVKEAAKNDSENEACLIRIYLGENEADSPSYDTLLNFPLRLNMLEQLNLNATILSDEIAIALATIHWHAQIDGMDSEFVLGSAVGTPSPRGQAYDSQEKPREDDALDFTFNTRSMHVWVLDFDKARSIELTPEDVEKYLVPAFLGNDPYFPRPDVNIDLWESFSRTYLKASQVILENKNASSRLMELPGLFLEKVVSKIKEHEDWNPEEHIVFG